MSNQSALWNHFDKDPQKLIGVCRYCGNSLSYKSTSTNLKEHLKRKHKTVYDELVGNKRISETASHPTRNDPVWNYYEKHSDAIALCGFCSSEVTFCLLYYHLKVTHTEAYETIIKILKDRENELEASHPTRDDQIWNYYEKHTHCTALCSFCSSEVSFCSLYRHLKVTHPGTHETLMKLRNHPENELEAIIVQILLSFCFCKILINAVLVFSFIVAEDQKMMPFGTFPQFQTDCKTSKPKRKDPIWIYYNDHSNTTALCRSCLSEVSFCSMYRHLKITHPKTHEDLMNLLDDLFNVLEGELSE